MSLPEVTGIHSILPCNDAWYREGDPALRPLMCEHMVVLKDGTRYGHERIMSGAEIVELCFRLDDLTVLDPHFNDFLDDEQKMLITHAKLRKTTLDHLLVSSTDIRVNTCDLAVLGEKIPQRHVDALESMIEQVRAFLDAQLKGDA